MTWFPSTQPVSPEEIAYADHLVVHCWGVWNGADQAFDKNLHLLSQEFLALAAFRSCDVDDPRFFSTLRDWGIVNVPALVLLERGRKIDVSYGLSPIGGLESVLREWLIERTPRDSDQERPRFQIGEHVRVVLNEHNRTPRAGTISRAVWHFKYSCWHYFLTVDGAAVSKRYVAEDLVPAREHIGKPPRS